jgi:hypothetical protein
MFDVVVSDPHPAAELRARAAVALAGVVAAHAELRANDLTVRRDFLAAHDRRAQGSRTRAWAGERSVLELRLDHLARVRAAPAARAAADLPRLLRLIGSFIEALEMGERCLAVRIPTRGGPVPRARLALVPKPDRVGRVRRQFYAGEPPAGLEPSSVPCLGVRGNGYLDDALDRMDLVSLVLTFVSHVHSNT